MNGRTNERPATAPAFLADIVAESKRRVPPTVRDLDVEASADPLAGDLQWPSPIGASRRLAQAPSPAPSVRAVGTAPATAETGDDTLTSGTERPPFKDRPFPGSERRQSGSSVEASGSPYVESYVRDSESSQSVARRDSGLSVPETSGQTSAHPAPRRSADASPRWPSTTAQAAPSDEGRVQFAADRADRAPSASERLLAGEPGRPAPEYPFRGVSNSGDPQRAPTVPRPRSKGKRVYEPTRPTQTPEPPPPPADEQAARARRDPPSVTAMELPGEGVTAAERRETTAGDPPWGPVVAEAPGRSPSQAGVTAAVETGDDVPPHGGTPQVHIGEVQVVVTTPPTASRSTSSGDASSVSSRRYLRTL